MRSLSPLFGRMALAWWRWARAELTARNPFHPDLPFIVMRVTELEDRYGSR